MLSNSRKRRFFDKMSEIYTPPKRPRAEKAKTSNISPSSDEKTMKEAPQTRVDEKIHIVPLGKDMTRKRLEIWKTQLQKMGITLEDTFHTGVTVVVASTTLSRAKLTAACPNCGRIVTPEWLIQLIKTKQVPTSTYQWCNEDEVQKEAQAVEETKPPTESPPQPEDSPPHFLESSLEPLSSTPLGFSNPSQEANDEATMAARRDLFYKNNPGMRAVHAEENTKPDKRGGFVCMTSSVLKINHNTHLTGPFEELIAYLTVEHDEWRVNSYKRMVSILKQLPEKVTDASTLKPQHGFNAKGIAKVRELLETGTLRKLEAKKADARLQVLRKFSDIWGVGPSTATDLYSSGYRSLDDLRAKQEILNDKQRIGLKHYDDFLVKIPRNEVEEIEAVVKKHIHRLAPHAVAITCGSYRRGKSQSGDVDILVSDPTRDDCNILPRLLKDLHGIGFLTDDLTMVYEHHIGGCDSYMGVCRLAEGMRYRRIDIKVYPRNLFGFAQLYFTGSDHFNRSMRAYAKTKGYSLTDKGLYKATRAKGVKKLKKGPNLICPDERDVFIALHLPYKRPEERNCMA
ncbi:hypothetical protein Ae201684_012369 [Aphanomyces euteiches]|uniref:DNA polymerase n=1 Tax=Aphanomyces euteiches TaxID=100861 RepID=A0A6G0WSH1_9STRA|nr:hypothetical protein Ae201684_012369 [Aphanomyces euteiches]KAH9157114.1 hypothetical protein AeRB84_001038 [Aphanomyces euteiches]